jgi:hypothetical protein
MMQIPGTQESETRMLSSCFLTLHIALTIVIFCGEGEEAGQLMHTPLSNVIQSYGDHCQDCS